VILPPHVLKFVTSALFLRRHIATRLLPKGTVFCKLGLCPKRVLEHIASQWTLGILFLETIVHFHSYERYKILHTGSTTSCLDNNLRICIPILCPLKCILDRVFSMAAERVSYLYLVMTCQGRDCLQVVVTFWKRLVDILTKIRYPTPPW
jgi:hypothetical protein